MKKYIAIILIVCMAFCTVGCQKQQEDTGPVVRYFVDAGREVDDPHTFVIESRAQLEQHVKWIIGSPKEVKLRQSEEGKTQYGENKPFIDYCENYTDSFFEEKYLVIVYCRLPSCTFLLQSQGLIITPMNQLCIFLDAVLEKERVDYINGSYAFDEGDAGWHVVYELDRDAGVAVEDGALVYLDTGINIFKDVI